MVISENTRAAKMEENFQTLQQSCLAFQNDIKNRMEAQRLQLEQFQLHQEKINSNLNALITGLS